MMERHTRITIGLGVLVAVLAFVVVGLLTRALGPQPQDEPEIVTAPLTAEAITNEQQYLDAVWPHLSPDREHDAMTVLSSGLDGVCGVWAVPADSRPAAVDLLMRTGPYSLTEATAIYESAVEFLCPA